MEFGHQENTGIRVCFYIAISLKLTDLSQDSSLTTSRLEVEVSHTAKTLA